MMNSFDKIAIVGMDALFPGGERGLEEHWLNVLAGKDCARQVPAQRWHGLSAARLQSVDVQPDRVASTRACLLADGMEFDLADLQLPAELLRDLDPMYLALLHVGRRLWRACGNTDPQRVGIIIGNIVLPTEQAARLSAQLLHSDFVANAPHALNGQVAGLPAALLARALKFSGTAWTLDAACASSLYALKYACDELLAGRADCMLSGGLSRPDCLYTQMGFTQLRALSPSGCCRPFDHKADGLVVGEGCGLLALKRLGDAVAEGDRIYATIEGIGIANDLGGSLMQPDSEGQLRAMRMAYEQAAWEPESVQHIECHGTGTPTGDSVELRSLRSLWEGRAGRCVIGSVKSNIGHLLTAAGSASMIKTLLAMRDGQFPPTANFDHAPEDFALEDSPFHVLASAEPWLAPEGEPRRAAVSGFGFGGINAHVLVQEYLAAQPPAAEARVEVIREIPRCDAVAIVGLAARLGGMSEMQAITDRLLADDDESPQSPEPLGTLRLPFGKYPIPPNELRQLLPQQLVMLETADEALRTAGWLEMSHEQRCRMGVFIGIGLDFNSCNFHLRWVRDSGAELGHGGSPLNADRTMGALGGIVASRVARVFQVGGPAFTFSSEETSGLHALEAAVRALRNGELDRVLIGAVDLPCDKRMRRLLGEEFQNMRSVLQSNASVSSASAMPVDTAIAMTLMRADDARARGDRVYAVIGDVSSSGAHAEVEDGVEPILPSPGYAGAAQGMLVLLRAVLALQHRVLPMRTKMRYWLHDRHLGQRRAMIAQDNLAGGRVTAILEEGDFNDSVRIGVGHQERLFLLAAQDAHGLLSELENLRFDRLPDAVLGAKRIALRAGDPESLRAVAQRVAAAVRAEQSLDDAQACYFPDPAECAGDLAFVFPGSGNHYLGMGRELSAIFPDVLETRHRENEFLKSQFCDAAFWEERDAGHELTPRDFIFTQVSVGIFIHDVVTQFGIAADAMIGYSLGETTALFAARAWRDSDEMLRRVNAGTLFTEDLAGSCRAAQRHWGVDAPVHWQAGVVRAPVERLRAAIAEFPRVYLLIINTPKECVIGGERASVMALTKQLGIHLHAIPGVISVHCAVAEEVGESYRDLHLFETTSPPNLRFYSGTRGSSYVVNRDSAADSILGQAVQPFDYTQVIESAWRDGIRHFIELGPGRSCTKMIDAILHDRPHYSQAICVRGKNEVQGLLAALSGLHCRGYSVDAERLVGMYPPPAAMEIKPVLEIDVDSDLVGLRAAVPLPNALPNAAASAASPALPDAVADSRVDRGIADSSSSFVHEHFERLNAGFDTALQRLRAIYPGIAATTSPDSTAEPP
ncbi:MAG: beta-ketoacyl synthase N-terminal-like domain-containing protein, partial [Candidatus Eutrophobiaceae bacterium]